MSRPTSCAVSVHRVFTPSLASRKSGAPRACGINNQAISISEIKVSVLIEEDCTELSVRVLHTAYRLDAEDAAA